MRGMQTPFCTIFLYINEVPEGQTRSDLTLIIEEVLKQRMQGVKNEKGVWITPAFPKLIYVLQENNISEKSEYFYLTKLAAKCSAKRLVPDYFSEKVTGKYAITTIQTAWRTNQDAFEVLERTNELKYNAAQTWEADRIMKELPETLEARKSRECIIMNLAEARQFFEVDFKKSWLSKFRK